MSGDSFEPGINRRQFLKTAAGTAVAAAATGTGVALLVTNQQQGPAPFPPQPPPLVGPTRVPNLNRGAELLARLTAAEAQNIRLEAELQATQRRLASAQAAAGHQQDDAIKAWQSQLNEANGRADALAEQVGILSSLVTLYEELQRFDIETVVDAGIASVDDAINDLAERIPGLQEGLQMGQEALDEFEEQVPLVHSGRLWLSGQVDNISALYVAVEQALENTLEATGHFLYQLEAWFEDILKWLPFGLGEKASITMKAMANLLAETPNTLAGLDENVARPLDQWLANENGEMRLQQRLIRPIRDQAFHRAAETVEQAETISVIYQTALVEPVRTVAEQRTALSQQIAQYRQTHQV